MEIGAANGANDVDVVAKEANCVSDVTNGVAAVAISVSPVKEGESETSSAETSLSIDDTAQHGRPAVDGEVVTETVAEARDVSSEVVSQKIARVQDKKAEDKEDEKLLAKMHKKTLKELKEQLDPLQPDEKARVLEKKYCEKVHEFNKFERTNERLQRQHDNLQREADTISQELSRTKGVKTKLEALSKQLQKQNKQVLEDCKKTALEDKERKREQQEKFASKIQDVQARIEAHDNERRLQATEGEKLREQLQSFITQYEVRDKHFEAQVQAKDLEKQMAEAKHAEAEERCRQAIRDAEQFKQQAEELAGQELGLREQLGAYSDKYKDFQETLSKSNEMFASFKKESDKMHKRIKSLEKEKRELVGKMDKTNSAIKDLTVVRAYGLRGTEEVGEGLNKELQATSKQGERLQGLCATLTSQNADLRRRLGIRSDDDSDEAVAPAAPAPPAAAAVEEEITAGILVC